MNAHPAHPADAALPGLTPAGYSHQILAAASPDPTRLRAGSFVYLWAPGETRGGDQRILARVERTTKDVILARDLASGVRSKYEVGEVYPEQLRWSWELAAPPERPSVPYAAPAGIEVIDRRQMDLAARREWLFGPVGATVRISCKDGGVVVGVPVQVMVDGDEWDIKWVLVQGPTDARGPITHRVEYENIGTVTVIGDPA